MSGMSTMPSQRPNQYYLGDLVSRDSGTHGIRRGIVVGRKKHVSIWWLSRSGGKGPTGGGDTSVAIESQIAVSNAKESDERQVLDKGFSRIPCVP